MATVNPPATTTPVGGTTLSGTSSVSNPNATLDKDGFLKLFIAQLSHQDPSKPMDSGESMAQMAQFTMTEQMTNMATSNTKIASALNTSSAVGLIGRTVSY